MPGIVYQDVDLTVCVDGFLHQAFDLRPLGYVDCHGERLSSIGLNVFHNRVESILAPSSQNDRCAQLAKAANGTLSETAARTRDDDDFPFNIPVHGCLLVGARHRLAVIGKKTQIAWYWSFADNAKGVLRMLNGPVAAMAHPKDLKRRRLSDRRKLKKSTGDI